MNIEQLRIQQWARGWNDAMLNKPLQPNMPAGYVLGYMDAKR